MCVHTCVGACVHVSLHFLMQTYMRTAAILEKCANKTFSRWIQLDAVGCSWMQSTAAQLDAEYCTTAADYACYHDNTIVNIVRPLSL